jgi:hypothetical protein
MLRVAACSYEGSLFGWDINHSSTSIDGERKEVAVEVDKKEDSEVSQFYLISSSNAFVISISYLSCYKES